MTHTGTRCYTPRMTPTQTIELIKALLNELESQVTAVQPRVRAAAIQPPPSFVSHADPPSVLKALGKHKDGLRVEQLRGEVEGDPSKALKALVDTGKVKKKGAGRSTTYLVTG